MKPMATIASIMRPIAMAPKPEASHNKMRLPNTTTRGNMIFPSKSIRIWRTPIRAGAGLKAIVGEKTLYYKQKHNNINNSPQKVSSFCGNRIRSQLQHDRPPLGYCGSFCIQINAHSSLMLVKAVTGAWTWRRETLAGGRCEIFKFLYENELANPVGSTCVFIITACCING